MQDYKPNSHRFREEQKNEALPEKRVEKVVTGVAKTKKKSEISKLAGVFISEDAKNVKDYLIWDVGIPTLKRAILSALDMMLNGGNASYQGGRSNTSKVSYRDYWNGPRSSRPNDGPRTRFDYDDIVFQSRGAAEAVLFEMEAVIDKYRFVTVADLYDMADVSNPPFTANKYGWTNLRNAQVVQHRDRDGWGYIIKLPKALPIDQ